MKRMPGRKYKRANIFFTARFSEDMYKQVLALGREDRLKFFDTILTQEQFHANSPEFYGIRLYEALHMYYAYEEDRTPTNRLPCVASSKEENDLPRPNKPAMSSLLEALEQF